MRTIYCNFAELKGDDMKEAGLGFSEPYLKPTYWPLILQVVPETLEKCRV